MSWRPPPSKDNPVVVEGLWGDDLDLPPRMPSGGRSLDVLAIALEDHIRRLIEVNLGRNGHRVIALPLLNTIPAGFPEPDVFIYDAETVTESDVQQFFSDRHWSSVQTVKLDANSPFGLATKPRLREATLLDRLTQLAICVIAVGLCYLAISRLALSAWALIAKGSCLLVSAIVTVGVLWIALQKRR